MEIFEFSRIVGGITKIFVMGVFKKGYSHRKGSSKMFWSDVLQILWNVGYQSFWGNFFVDKCRKTSEEWLFCNLAKIRLPRKK